ncbi:MAG: hypothetical protein AAFV53_23815 [Myxococcota bacterium]
MHARLRLWMVFFVALCVIGLETVTFQALSVVNEYLRATLVLSVALMGISLGGVLAWLAGDRRPALDHIALLLLPITLMASLFVVMWVNPNPPLMMVLLTVPYVLASFFVSRMFSVLPPAQVYAWDLVGAGLSSLVVVLAVPVLREEGTFFLFGVLGSVPALLMANEQRTGRSLAAAATVLALSGGLLTAQFSAGVVNMITMSTADKDEFGDKIFQNWVKGNGAPRWVRMYSRGSLIERIDIVHKPGERRSGRWYSVYNGRLVDAITRDKAKLGRLDNRMPTHLKLGQNPDTLLVGPSGQGLCKAVQALGDGHIDAVEINGAIAGLMSGKMYKRSGEAYGGMDLTVGDVRTFLKTTDRNYDYITMLNTHRIWSMGHLGPPEYVHTLEAMRDYFAHLKPDGYLLFEERNINQRAELGIRRMIHTARQALIERGAQSPEDHFLIWELYHGCPPAVWFHDPEQPGQRCKRRKLFTFVMVKNTPITAEEEAHLRSWGRELGERKSKPKDGYRGIIWRHMPSLETGHVWSEVVQAERLEMVSDADPSTQNLRVITDDVPYPYDVFTARTELWGLLRQVSLLSLVMVLLPGALAFVGMQSSSDAGRSGRSGGSRGSVTGTLVAFFALLGLAYLLVEVVLIQKFALFLGSPAMAMAVILGTMLVSSGIGGALTAGSTPRRALAAMGLTVLWVGGYLLTLDEILQALFGLPASLRVVAAAALVAPLAGLMGVPFPFAMRLTRRALSDRHAGLMFAVNGGLSAIAAPMSLMLSMTLGFRATLAIAGGLYLLTMALLAAAARER